MMDTKDSTRIVEETYLEDLWHVWAIHKHTEFYQVHFYIKYVSSYLPFIYKNKPIIINNQLQKEFIKLKINNIIK